MRVNLNHSLGKEEVRRRLEEHGHEIAGYFPAGMATVDTVWANEDRMDLTVHVAGQSVKGGIEVEADHVVIEFDLPAALGFLRGMIERTVKKEAAKMLEKA